ncbi:hypothetical protein MLD38_030831 [Melastoma candidum]|uniref:Uncharacterized protein n=1 Tax=Melastoma candidum TaxID=119954 RepID=A0ACB9MSX4_9MYRT|nr:hypothetical protein MLD38_030831 [Melastoma candidum]
MEKWRTGLVGSSAASVHQHSHPETCQRGEGEAKDLVAARKVQKADREKLRRDRLNDHFIDLADTLDPDGTKNDKATILADTIQMLNDLASEVNKLKAECSSLTEESRELTQEKNELKEEKAAMKSEIENLNLQYQQRLRVMFPWSATDMPVIMAPPPYPYPAPIAMPPGPIPMHAPPMQCFPYFGSQNPTTVPAPCSAFIPYTLPANPSAEHPSIQHASSSGFSNQQSGSQDRERRIDDADPADNSNNVATDLELKMPGTSKEKESTGERNGKQATERSLGDESSSNKISSSKLLQDDSSSSVGDIPKSGT